MRDIHIAGPWMTTLEETYVLDAMRHWYGKEAYFYVEKFEREFADYIGRRYCLMTPNATSALHLALLALDINRWHEVVVPDLTWIASAAPVVYEHATPVFCDVELDSWCLSRHTVEEARTRLTRAVIAVDLHGNMPDMDELEKYCLERDLFLIEDSAQALGSSYKDKKAGRFGSASVFSFHRTKTIVTGEGGAFLTDDDLLYRKAKMYRDHGRVVGDKAYWNRVVGYKYMPSNVLAAIACGQLEHVEMLVQFKRDLLKDYRAAIDLPGISFNEESHIVRNGAWVTGLVWDDRYHITKQQMMDKLERAGVPPRPFFYCLSDLPAFEYVRHRGGNTPNAHWLSEHGINLPCAFDLDDEQVEFISDTVKGILESVYEA